MLGRVTSTRRLEPQTRTFLEAAPEERLEAVAKAAEAHAATLSA
jgi:hypothetical protein